MALALFMCAVLGQAELQPIPSLTELMAGRKLVESVYGPRIEAAKTSEQKAAVAAEILAIAEKEQNLANRYAGYQVARRLAVEAEDGKLGLAVVRQFASEFQPPLPKEDWAGAAEKAWEAAESEKGNERLAGRLDAAECWLRAGEEGQAGFAAVKWRERIGELEGGETKVASAAGKPAPFALAGTVWKLDGNAKPPFWSFDATGNINNGADGKAIPISPTQAVRMSDRGVLMIFTLESPTKAKGVWLKPSGIEHVFTRVK